MDGGAEPGERARQAAERAAGGEPGSAGGGGATQGPHASEALDPEGGWPLEFDSGALPVGSDMSGHDARRFGPKPVVLSVFVGDLVDVDPASQKFRAKLQMTLDWVDDGALVKGDELDEHSGSTSSGSYWSGPYQFKEAFAEDPAESTFNPQIALVNAVEDDAPVESATCQQVYRLRGRPVVSRYLEFFTTFRTNFDLRQFPFDESDLCVEMTSAFWGHKDVRFVWSDCMRQGLEACSSRAVGGRGLSEFEIVGVDCESGSQSYAYLGRYDDMDPLYPHVVLRLRVRHDPFSYLTRVALVTVMLMMLEALSFLVDASDLGGRFSVSGTCFLSLCAFSSVTFESLPKAAVVTRSDRWNLANFFLIFVSNLENVAVFAALRSEAIDPDNLARFEVGCAVAYVGAVLATFAWFVAPLWAPACCYGEGRARVGAHAEASKKTE